MSDFAWGGGADLRCPSCQVEWARFYAGPWCWVCGAEGLSKFASPRTVEEQADDSLGAFLLSRSELP